ncbi:MAG: hypothetical protein J3R72DRAFT_447794 [Linnemannia gamsii]|nr:MAG: hypothetical protein J3R72DRAFT_447794 [Linnemannia gamsii]
MMLISGSFCCCLICLPLFFPPFFHRFVLSNNAAGFPTWESNINKKQQIAHALFSVCTISPSFFTLFIP